MQEIFISSSFGRCWSLCAGFSGQNVVSNMANVWGPVIISDFINKDRVYLFSTYGISEFMALEQANLGSESYITEAIVLGFFLFFL